MRAVFLCFLLFASCSEEKKILPSSTGKDSEILFVADDFLWENTIDSLVKKTLGVQIEGISQVELLFRIIQVNHHEFKSILKHHTNIVIVSEGGMLFKKYNKWANNQFVAQLNWTNNPDSFLEELIELRNEFTTKEEEKIKYKLKKSSKKNIEKIFLNNFGVDCIVPREYQVIYNDSTLFWANYDPPNSDEIKNILAFSFIPKTANLQEEVLAITDSIFARYLKGAKQGSYARIAPEYPPYYYKNIYRGLWKLENGFMGGPFIIKTYFEKNKIIVTTGFVFAPQSRKRKYIKEFEAIL